MKPRLSLQGHTVHSDASRWGGRGNRISHQIEDMQVRCIAAKEQNTDIAFAHDHSSRCQWYAFVSLKH